MLKFSRSVGYALQSILQLARAQSTEPIPCSRLAAEGHMPERFLLQVLRGLVNHGILVSTRGVEGGYALAKSPEGITLLELIEAVDGPVRPDSAVPHRLPSPASERLRSALDRVADGARQDLANVTVAHLMQSEHPAAPT